MKRVRREMAGEPVAGAAVVVAGAADSAEAVEVAAVVVEAAAAGAVVAVEAAAIAVEAVAAATGNRTV
jgi:hypothetical protein